MLIFFVIALNLFHYHLLLAIAGRLALKLVDRGNYSMCKSSVIIYVYQSTLFASVPLQATVDALHTGCSVAERSGDMMYSVLNKSAAANPSVSILKLSWSHFPGNFVFLEAPSKLFMDISLIITLKL